MKTKKKLVLNIIYMIILISSFLLMSISYALAFINKGKVMIDINTIGEGVFELILISIFFIFITFYTPQFLKNKVYVNE